MKNLLAALIFVVPFLGYGISDDINENNAFPKSLEDEPRVPGYIDANGKQGFFTIYGKDMPEKGYEPDGKIEEGSYKDDRKIGEWIFYHLDGSTPRLKGNFVDGRPNGPYVRYSENGAVIEESAYNNKKQVGAFKTYYDDGTLKQEKTFNAEGKEEGPVTFYYETGQVQYEGTMVNGVPTGEATRYWEDGSVKEVLVYSSTGELLSTTVVNAEPPVAVTPVIGTGGPSGVNGILKDGSVFQMNGYNKVYNEDEDLWMDGNFKAGKLWNGKLYKYDEDGILLKIEIWKNGAYHSDGQL